MAENQPLYQRDELGMRTFWFADGSSVTVIRPTALLGHGALPTSRRQTVVSAHALGFGDITYQQVLDLGVKMVRHPGVLKYMENGDGGVTCRMSSGAHVDANEVPRAMELCQLIRRQARASRQTKRGVHMPEFISGNDLNKLWA
ncbi:hypothetical protein HON52_04320 [Candidatus Uhrbacteria bacterium]|nr:hypothetical protein [Candidatus Uhrbacteria bacterium]